MNGNILKDVFNKKVPIMAGFWISIISGIVWIYLMVKFMLFIVQGWNNIVNNPYTYMTFNIIPGVPLIILSSCLLTIMVCIYYNSQNSLSLFGKIGNQFLLIFTIVIFIDHCLKYYLNISANEKFINENDIFNILSIINGLSYCFLAVSNFFYYVTFNNNGINLFIKNLFLINCLIVVWGITMTLFNKPYMIISAMLFWFIILPVQIILFIFHFINEGNKRIKLLENEIEYIDTANYNLPIKNDRKIT